MYLNIGGGALIKKDDIVGIFDLDTSTVGGITKEFLKRCETESRSETVGDDIPKAYIVTSSGKIYITTISAASLKGRNSEILPGMISV